MAIKSACALAWGCIIQTTWHPISFATELRRRGGPGLPPFISFEYLAKITPPTLNILLLSHCIIIIGYAHGEQHVAMWLIWHPAHSNNIYIGARNTKQLPEPEFPGSALSFSMLIGHWNMGGPGLQSHMRDVWWQCVGTAPAPVNMRMSLAN